MFGSLGFPEILMILLIVIILFGAAKLPQLGRGLGEGIRNFKDSMNEGKNGTPKDDSNSSDDDDDAS